MLEPGESPPVISPIDGKATVCRRPEKHRTGLRGMRHWLRQSSSSAIGGGLALAEPVAHATHPLCYTSPGRLARAFTPRCRHRWTSLVILFLAVISARSVIAAEPVQFNRDIRPILAEHCWKCHGFDPSHRAAGLRLDDRAAATKPADSGAVAIVPGDSAASELIIRLETDDESLRMPPRTAAKRPNRAEIDLLKRWIAEGAEYQPHWAFAPLIHAPVPAVEGVTHPVDAFVATKLKSIGRRLAPAADRDTLIRRVYFDLIGLPPTPEQLDTARRVPWEQTVDVLLASPHFGERMAVDWLDAARYADTDGYFGDKPRQMWLWRDWVIRAFNENMPFDQFTIEQLAGDLLPNATISQKVATGFNRNHMTNDETGLIDEEYRVEYVADRVDTTMSTWLGLTIACAHCHDHKYDPVSQRKYYQLFAYFNNVPETGLLLGSDAPPRISVPSAEQEQQLAELANKRAEAQAAYEPLRKQAVADLARREAELLVELAPLPDLPGSLHVPLNGTADGGSRPSGTSLKPSTGIRGESLRFDATQHLEHDAAGFNADGPWTLGLWLTCENSLAAPLSKVAPDGDRRGLELLWQRGRIGLNLTHDWGASGIELTAKNRLPVNTWHHVVVRYDGSRRANGLTLFVNGQTAPVEIRRDDLTGSIATTEPLRIGRRDEGLGFYGSLDELRWLPAALSDEAVVNWYRGERIRGLLERPADKRAQREVDWLLEDEIDRRGDTATQNARRALVNATAAEKAVRDAIPLALVMDEKSPPRATHILERGVYNKPGDAVQPGVPNILSFPLSDLPPNRLGLARWLIDPRHPLTARVAVNRLWRQCFGDGLVRTVNDFGTQGEPPTHPELLDWLAATFRDNWDTKALLRLIVTSRSYQQDSAWPDAGSEPFDPDNRWLARGPRFRLPVEMLRDQALVASGLFVPTVGGPSVKPFQPPGLWEEVSYNAEAVYEIDTGPGRYRRSLYTFHKRQAPPPALLLFDGPTREKCTLKRPRTNTPLQALVLLNDETWLEASRSVAVRLLSSEGDDRARLSRAVSILPGRVATDTELSRLEELLGRARERFSRDADAAARFARQREPLPGRMTVGDVAAWAVVIQALFNLDEAVTRR